MMNDDMAVQHVNEYLYNEPGKMSPEEKKTPEPGYVWYTCSRNRGFVHTHTHTHTHTHKHTHTHT